MDASAQHRTENLWTESAPRESSCVHMGLLAHEGDHLWALQQMMSHTLGMQEDLNVVKLLDGAIPWRSQHKGRPLTQNGYVCPSLRTFSCPGCAPGLDEYCSERVPCRSPGTSPL